MRGREAHHDYHICSLSDLTGSKFGGNRAALISFPHTTHRHLVTCTRTQNLCSNNDNNNNNGKKKKKIVQSDSLDFGGFDLLNLTAQVQKEGEL